NEADRGSWAQHRHGAVRGVPANPLDQDTCAQAGGADRDGTGLCSGGIASRARPTVTHQAWLSLGANLGDPPAQLREAVRRIEAHPQIRVTAQSQLVMTTAWGKTDQPDFCNMAVTVETELQPL